ncbi:MAG: hypothetical protein IT442_17175 [Phycisphaeraceae bacterium]|nr:hypothetical protein [Phycisphaeraceae bacterium]
MGDVLVGTAVWHEDIHDPGDSSHVSVTLKLTGDRLEFSFCPLDDPSPAPALIFNRLAVH